MNSIKALIALISITLFLSACEDDHKEVSIATIAEYVRILEDEAQEGTIIVELDESLTEIGNTCIDWTTHVMYIPPAFIEAYNNGSLSKEEALFILCHEIGHLNPYGHTNQGGYQNELFADAYGLLLWDEFNTDYHLHMDEYKAIQFFLDYPNSGNAAHPPSIQRYKILKAKLDFWKKHEHDHPETGV